MRIKCDNPAAVVKRAFWLAWQACGGPLGMGWLQDNPSSTEDSVWANVQRRGDYPGGEKTLGPGVKDGEAYGDYVFGRMMKLGIRWGEDYVEAREDKPRGDYQAWCFKYPTYAALVEAAILDTKS